jgi:hypothetical protein
LGGSEIVGVPLAIIYFNGILIYFNGYSSILLGYSSILMGYSFILLGYSIINYPIYPLLGYHDYGTWGEN